MEISAELVKTLREKTNCGFMDCKKALKETQGDIEAAVTYLRQKGIAVATKRAERTTSEGAIWAHVASDAKTGVLLEVNCESDFVAKTDGFQTFGEILAGQIADRRPRDLDTLLAQPWEGQGKASVQEYSPKSSGRSAKTSASGASTVSGTAAPSPPTSTSGPRSGCSWNCAPPSIPRNCRPWPRTWPCRWPPTIPWPCPRRA